MATNRDEWETETEVKKTTRYGKWDALLTLPDEDKSSREQAKSLVPAMKKLEAIILRKKAALPADATPAAKAEVEELREVREPVAARLRVLTVAHDCGWDTVKIMENNDKTGDDKKVQEAFSEAKKNRVAAKAEKNKGKRGKPYNNNKGRGGGGSSGGQNLAGSLSALSKLASIFNGNGNRNNNN